MTRFVARMLHLKYRRDVLAVLAILGMWLLFYWRLFTPVAADRVQLASGDFTQQFLVFRNFAVTELRQGRLPTWMPCIDSGYPYQADPQSALFYPPALLNTLLHVATGATQFSISALELEAALHVLLAALLSYAFLRSEVRSRAAALLGALAFGFGGYLTGYPILQLAILESAAWLPLALWAARRLATRGDGRSAALLALPLALSVLAGHPQTYAFVFYLVAIYLVYRARRERVGWRGVFLRLAAAFGLAIILSAVQLLPTIEYMGLSTRANLSYLTSGTGFPLADVFQLLIAGVVSHFSPLYIGLLPLALAALAIVLHRKHHDTIFWLIAAVVGLLLSFGRNLAIFDGFYWLVPGYQLFRDQERHALIASFALSVLAAYGSDVLLHSLSRRARAWLRGEMRWLGLVAILLIAALGIALYLSGQGGDSNWPDRVALAAIALTATLSVFALRSNRAARRAWLPVLLITVAAFDLATANRDVNWVAPYEPFPTQTPITAIRSDAQPGAVFRIHDEQRLPGHTACMNGLNEVGGITPIRVGNYNLFLQAVPREIRWQLLNVRYVVTYRGVLDGHLGQPVNATRLSQQGDGKDAIYTYRLNDATPRAWIVHDVETQTDRAAILAAMSAPGFDPQHLAFTASPVQVAANEASEPIAVVDLEPARLVIDADLAAPGLLVTSEVNYPGWMASVNGVYAPIIEADGVLRGMVLPGGHSRIKFDYQPPALIIGGALSSIGVLIGLGLILVVRRKKRM